jgi:Trm5-related predicted tRNA methylase
MESRKKTTNSKVRRSFLKSSKPVVVNGNLLKVINTFPVFCIDLKLKEVEMSTEERAEMTKCSI